MPLWFRYCSVVVLFEEYIYIFKPVANPALKFKMAFMVITRPSTTLLQYVLFCIYNIINAIKTYYIFILRQLWTTTYDFYSAFDRLIQSIDLTAYSIYSSVHK